MNATQDGLFGQQSTDIEMLADALSKAQAEMEAAKKDSTNKFLSNHKYADLGSIKDAIREPFANHGLAVVQLMSTIVLDNKIETALVTKLLHKSGQWIAGVMPLLLTKADPQAQGSAITYARRYCLAAIAGVVQEDDDAQGATKKPSQQTTSEQRQEQSQSESGSGSKWTDLVAIAVENQWHEGYVRQWIKDQGKKGVPESDVYVKATEKFGKLNKKAENDDSSGN